MCRETRHLIYDDESTSVTWDLLRKDLVEHISIEENCKKFHLYFFNKWNPRFFDWPMVVLDLYLKHLLNDENWFNLWKKPVILGKYYAHGLVPEAVFDIFPDYYIRIERTQHVYHLLSLLYGTVLIDIGGLKALNQVIEFGGGTGDMAACFRDMSYVGTYVILDLEPVLYFQQYFHRFSGIPAYIVRTPKDQDAYPISTSSMASSSIAANLYTSERASRNSNRTHLATISELPYIFDNILDHSTDPEYFASSTLFIATWSLGESPIKVRDDVLSQIMKHKPGFILLAFADNYDGISNTDWAQTVLFELFIEQKYSMCWYKMTHLKFVDPTSTQTMYMGKDSYIVASKWSEHRMYSYCDKRAGCSEENKILGINCEFR